MLVKQVGIMADPSIAGTMIDGARKCYAESKFIDYFTYMQLFLKKKLKSVHILFLAKADDPCELAWLFTKCIYASDPSTFFFP